MREDAMGVGNVEQRLLPRECREAVRGLALAEREGEGSTPSCDCGLG